MISRLGLAISRLFRASCPDPFTLAIFLTVLTAALALLFGTPPPAPPDDDAPPRVIALLQAWCSSNGLWKFLPFAMQMCLILVTGHALACTRPIRALIDVLADLPRSTASAAALVGLVASVGGLINWGLGLIVGALLARDVGRSLSRRGIRVHYPLICAAGYMGLLVWHGGLSGTAPLAMTTLSGAEKVMPDAWVAERRAENVRLSLPEDAGIPLGETIGSSMNLVVCGGLLVGVPLLLTLLAPRNRDEMEPIDAYDLGDHEPGAATASPTLPDRMDRSWLVAWLLAAPLLAAVVLYVRQRGFGSLDLNTINATMLALGLILHASPRAYMDAVAEGARGCAGIMIQFPLYGGIMGMMQAFGLVEMLARGFAAIGNQTTIPMLSYGAAAVVNLFVPSGGGQWGIQGPVALETGLQADIAPGTMIMAVAYGDQLTNMLQPFWALPLLAITGVRARDIVGYTAIVMVAAGVWMGVALVLF